MRLLLLAAALALPACAIVPREDRLITSQPAPPRALPARSLRVLSWNIHKAKDPGIHADLARRAADSDLLLLQEAVLDQPTRQLLERAGFSWQMADAFTFRELGRGVLIAARATPLDGRALRAYEPLFHLPKSAIHTHYALAGQPHSVAVANLHGINFSLGMVRFRQQLQAIATDLALHKGPIIFAGDFNTWSARRLRYLEKTTRQLGLSAIAPTPDQRRRAFGKPLDHLFVRGFSVTEARALAVTTSDHSPLQARLAVTSP